MQPQQPQGAPTLNSGPHGELDPNYGFIFNGQQKPGRRFPFKLPGSNNLTRIVLLVIAGGAILGILLIVVSSVLGSKGVHTKEVTDVIGRAEEIARVSDLVAKQSRDVATQNLAATTATSLTSQEEQLLLYLKKYHKKIVPKQLHFYQDSTTDTQMQTAASTNSLTPTYYAYLKKHMADYNNSIKTAEVSSGPIGKSILQNASSSNQILLSSPQLATATAQ
jgi:hypothetical protein